ncbi:helix-turn-helix domain-containing protein [Halobellus clavatus]|jgi:predicted DNA binding protein|uniref:HTH DNA binding domain-containing protein n=1 Tax=Halobellus clavatus TaxID=660517 RepID=A0A1H3IJR2_9EURY|nr:helix-turn-helix domain-containing protein [Halobellus clavatus]SDY27625.1 HTH DNA binding domain-containing protein [Halobellus clavatus]
MPIIAKVYFSHPDMALANVISSFPDTNIRVLQEVSTDPVSDNSFFVVETEQTEALERELSADHTVEEAQRVSSYEDWPVYSIRFTPETLLLGSVVTEQNGFALDAYQYEGGWIERWQLPDRESLQSVWEYANDQSFDFDIHKVYQISESNGQDDTTITDKQRTALLYAYDNGYFEKPRGTTLEEIADALDISTTAASGRIYRGMKNLIESSMKDLSS